MQIRYGKEHSGIEKKHAFVLLGNSNGIAFMAYSKKAKLNHFDSEPVWDELRLRQQKDVLRFDVVLTTQRAIRSYTNSYHTVDRINDLASDRDRVFGETFIHIIPCGEFHKLPAAIKIVEKEVANNNLRRKMIQLIQLIPKKKSALLAAKELNARNIEAIIKEFIKIDLSPVSLSKRMDVNHLDNLYELITKK